MPNPRPGGLPTMALVLSLLAAGCTLSGHPPGTGRQAPHQAPYQESSAAAAEYLASPPTAASTPRYRVTPTMNIEISPLPRRPCERRR
jgi:hypothetical protein